MARDSGELRPQLREAQRTLGESLKAACAMDPSKANTGELIHIEELLAIANDSAKKAISVRRRLKKDGTARTESAPARGSESRVITDGSNVTWTIMAIHPSSSKSSLSGPYQTGWLAFDSGDETRRLAPIPDNWQALPDEELGRLAQQAKVAARKKTR